MNARRVGFRLSIGAVIAWILSCPGASALSVDNNSRESVRDFYNDVYLASDAAINWTGNHAACKEGDTAQAFKDDTLLRVNWFRVMAGVAEVTLDSSFNDDCQKAALMVSKGGNTEHHPPPSWPCFSPEGSNAAKQCNLSIGNTGWDAVTSQLRDSGANNYPCGHRRWILYPQTRKTATGNIPDDRRFMAAMALREWDEYWNTARPSTRKDYVSWPPAGYVPYQVVFGRWSFSYADADFSSATVTMKANGSSISAPLETIVGLYGENTLVWRPNEVSDTYVWPKPTADSNYTVEVSNVIIGGAPRTFNYTVTVFDPAVSGATPPARPTNVRASNGTYVNYVRVQWDDAAGATFYQVWRNTINDTDGAACIKERDLDLSYNDTTAVPEQEYYYFVRAGNDDGYSDYSVGNSGWAAMAAPAAPTGVKASDGTHEDRVVIEWNAVAGATLCQVWRNDSNSLNGAASIKNVAGHLNSANDYDATPGQGYYYWVRAENQGGWGPYSGSDSGHVAVAAAPPEAPDAFWASDGKYTNKVYLMAQIPAGTTGLDFWRAYQDNVDAATKIVANHPSGEYSDYDVTPGLYYFYWVQARNADGVSDFSPGDSGYASNAVHAPAKPPCISASQGTYLDHVTIEFCPVEYRTAYHYEIWRNAVDNPAGATCIEIIDPTESEATDSNLEPGTTNYYYVTATNQYGRGPFSDGAKGYTMAIPPAPTDLRASDGTQPGSVLVTWNGMGTSHASVWRHTVNNSAAATCIAPNLNQAYHIDYSAEPGQVYYYWAKAFVGSVTSGFSNADTGYASVENPPPAPGNVQATRGAYNNFIGVTWDKVLDADWYEVWRNTSENTATATRKDGHTTNNISWTDPAPSWLIGYYYWVRSVNENGTSTWSSAAYGNMAGPLSVPELCFATRLGNIWVMTMTNLTVGLTNYIQSTTNLMPGSQWIQRGAITPSRDRSFWIGLMPGEKRFYRIVVNPPDGP